MTRPSVANPFRVFSVVVLLVAALPAAALAGKVTQLTTNSVEDLNTDAAIDVVDNVHVVYERGGSIYYRGRTGTTWSAEELVAAGTSPAVGAGASGVPQVAFVSGGATVMFTARLGGTWIAPVPIGPGHTVDLAVDPGDVAHVVFLGNTDTAGDSAGYDDLNYTNNAGGAFPASPIRIWSSWYYYYSGSRAASYYQDAAPVVGVDSLGHCVIGYNYRWINGAMGWTDWGTSVHLYRCATDDDVSSPDWYKGTHPAVRRNGLVLSEAGVSHLVFGSTIAVIAGPGGAGTWTESALPAGSSHTLDTSPAPALHLAYVNGTGGIEYAVDDTGTGFGTPLVLSTTTSGRTPVVIAQTDPFVAYEAIDSGDYEVWFARTTNQAPVLDAIGARSVNEGASLSFTVAATDGDGDDLVYSASNLPAGATFTPATRSFSWTPDFTQAGSYTTVTFQVSDGTDTDSETITIDVNQVNAPPVLGAVGDKSVNENATLSFTLSATDIDNDELTFGAQNLPAGATLDPASGAFSWTPTHDQAGSFPGVVFTVTDNGTPNLSDSETITITVNDVNRAPVLDAIGDRSVNENEWLSFTVAATDADGDGLTYGASNLPPGASFDPGTRTFTWTPTYDQAGTHANVTFTVTDDGTPALGDSAAITITVNDVNRAPVLDAIGDKSVDEDATLSFTVSATDADGDGLTYGASNLPSGASFDPGTRTFTWTPTYDQAGSFPGVVFTVTDDGAPNLDDSEAITITVNDVNRAPALDPIGDKTVDENAALSFTVAATDADGNGLTYSASNLPAGATFDPATRTFSWTPTYDQAGTHANVTFTATDEGTPALGDSEAITITVNDVNRAPVLDAIGDQTVDEDATLSFAVSAADADGDGLTYGASNMPSGASFDPGTRTFTWTPTYDQAGSYANVTFTATDDGTPNLDGSETITIIVSNVNRAPVLDPIGDKSVDENATLSFTISPSDPDGDGLIYTASNMPSGASFNTASGTFSWTPTYAQAGTYANVTFAVTDDGTPNLSDSEAITITVNDVNRAPVLDAIGDKSVDEGATLTFTVSATDGDAGDTLAFSATNLPAGATMNPATGAFSWTPTYEQAGSYPGVVFTVTDDGTPNLDDSETITITVNPVNAPPVLAAIGDRSVSEGASLSFTVSATDVDPDTLTYSASGLPTGATFDPGTRTFSWTPGYDQAGSHPGVVFTVTDDGTPVKNDSETITITVDNVNRAPVLDAIGDKSVMEGDALSFTVSATDEDGDTVTYSASNLPTGATFDPATRSFSWTPAYDQAGDHAAVVFTVADAEASDSESITITVTDNPTPPGFFTVMPCRVIDTREAAGEYGGPALEAGTDRTFDTVGGPCGIPATASAVSVNVTVTGATAAGNLRLFPAGVPVPSVSTINYTPGVTRANNAIVRLSELGELAVRCAPAGTVHFILDVNGYFQEEVEE